VGCVSGGNRSTRRQWRCRNWWGIGHSRDLRLGGGRGLGQIIARRLCRVRGQLLRLIRCSLRGQEVRRGSSDDAGRCSWKIDHSGFRRFGRSGDSESLLKYILRRARARGDYDARRERRICWTAGPDSPAAKLLFWIHRRVLLFYGRGRRRRSRIDGGRPRDLRREWQ
jgi:hypothetical protein